MSSFLSLRPLLVASLLVLAGCGARTSFRDDGDAGRVVGLDVLPGVDVPVTKPLDVSFPPPLDVSFPPPLDVSFPPPLDVPRAPVTCESAIPVTPGTMLTNQDTTGLPAIHLPCETAGANSLGAPIWYRVVVPAGRTLTATALRDSTSQPLSVRIQTACEATRCLAIETLPGDLHVISARWTNASDAPVEVFVAIGDHVAGRPAQFTFAPTLVPLPPPYTVARTSIACDDMSSGQVIATAAGDDVGTVAIPLPIRFSYFGAVMTSWSVSTNGYLQVWPGNAGMSVGALGVTALPSAMAPSNMIAPFWDDLEIRTAEMMDLRWLVVDAPARHLTVQWSNVGFCCGAGAGNPNRITFQTKLFTGTGAIEFHYCAQTSDMRAHGAGASVGIQNDDGTRGVSALFRSATIDPMTAFRLTPN